VFKDIKHMHYFSTVLGYAESLSGKKTVYRGLVFEVARDDLQTDAHKQLEHQRLSELYRLIEEHAQANWREGIPIVQCDPIERYEVFDFTTGNVWVMYRVPFQRLSSENSLWES
jgi:hypothetical protein